MNTIALAFVAGVSGSVGPCAAPRYLAIAGLAGSASGSARARTLLAFALGVTCASVLVVESSAIVVAALGWSSVLYLALGVTFLATGVWPLLGISRPACAHDPTLASSSGAAFVLGSACALVPSACCTPFLLGIGTLGASSTASTNAAAGAAFALGHLSALAVVVLGAWPLLRLVSDQRVRQAAQTVGAGLSLALAAYYAVLA